MSSTVTLKEAQAKLPELVGKLAKGDEVAITDDNRVVARIVGERAPHGTPRVPGNCKGMITLAVEDEEHLHSFKEYMP